jgi:Flp pilus assembly protein TadG
LLKSSKGSATVELIASLVLLIALALGGVQIALTLYARNVLLAAAHDGARRGIELGRSPAEAEALARDFIEDAAGGLVSRATVSAHARSEDNGIVLQVRVTGMIDVPGPVPIGIPFHTQATSSRANRP